MPEISLSASTTRASWWRLEAAPSASSRTPSRSGSCTADICRRDPPTDTKGIHQDEQDSPKKLPALYLVCPVHPVEYSVRVCRGPGTVQPAGAAGAAARVQCLPCRGGGARWLQHGDGAEAPRGRPSRRGGRTGEEQPEHDGAL